MKTLRSQPVLPVETVVEVQSVQTGPPQMKPFETAALLRTNCNCKNRPIHSWDDPQCRMYIPLLDKPNGTPEDTRFQFTPHKEPIKREEEVLTRVWNVAIAKNPMAFHDMMDTGSFNLDQAKLVVKALEEAGYWIIERDF